MLTEEVDEVLVEGKDGYDKIKKYLKIYYQINQKIKLYKNKESSFLLHKISNFKLTNFIV